VSFFTDRLLELLPAYGPWLLFALAFLETCFLTGLVVPAGLATALGTVLALDGELRLAPVVGAVLAGGALGDSVGYWVGRASGRRLLVGGGVWSRRLARRGAELDRWFGHHPAYSVSFARVIAFVRTAMPMAAGMSRIGYTRFLAYEWVGLVACVGLYVGIGALARGSWEVATRALGIGGALAFCAVTVAVALSVRRRLHGGRRDGRTGPGSPEDPAC
jgi:membrane-associated protein